MGKSGALGRSLLKNTSRKKATYSDRHTTTNHEDFSRLPVRSVTEESSLSEFFSIAELANSDFTAQKKTFRFLDRNEISGITSEAARQQSSKVHESYKGFLKIPRRPKWTRDMTNEELHALEKEELLKWRRLLAKLEQTEGIVMTPFEKNLEFWRQLWRVVERSDLLVQIVDARQPLLYYSSDLEAYAREVDPNKVCVVLINKSDFLTTEQRQSWADYFNSIGIRAIFWSAALASATSSGTAKSTSEHKDSLHEGVTEPSDAEPQNGATIKADAQRPCDDDDKDVYDNDHDNVDFNSLSPVSSDQEEDEDDDSSTEVDYSTAQETDTADDADHVAPEVSGAQSKQLAGNQSTEPPNGDKPSPANPSTDGASASPEKVSESGWQANSTHMFSAEELLNLFVTELYPPDRPRQRPPQLTVGFIGYPNVGKSSTLNALMGCKKTSVSATPGRTKHFQTLLVRPDLVLCDCPGLVMPSFVHSKADLVVAGILSIDEMRDCLSPIGLVCSQIPRSVLEFKYGIDLSKPKLDCAPLNAESMTTEAPPPTPHELLAAHAFMHGFMTAKGNPHYDRSARLILKDYVQGALLYCHPPPGVDGRQFQFLGRSDTGLPPSLAYADAAKLAKFQQLQQQQQAAKNKKAAAASDASTDLSSLISPFDQMAFQKSTQPRPHVRSRKHMLRPGPVEGDLNVDDRSETGSVLSSASWVTTDTVGGSSLLSGTESLRSNMTGSTATGVGPGQKKPWRLMSHSKRLVTVRQDPLGTGVDGSGRGQSRKRREKLRRVYGYLDQHEKT